MRAITGCVVACLLLTTAASAQWITVKLPRTPRTADGKPNLTAAAPRTADGKPDISGIWRRVASNKKDNEDGNFNLLDWMPDGAQIRMKPDAEAPFVPVFQYSAGWPPIHRDVSR